MSSYGVWLSAAGMKVQEHRQAVTANNLANLSTTGFKQDLAVITQRSVASMEAAGRLESSHGVLDELGGGVNVLPTVQSFEPGPLEWTGRPLDLAIDGPGLFTVSDGAETRYTRDGEFTATPEGNLILAAGNGRWRVLDEAGVPITVDPADGPVRITETGTVRQGANTIATIGVAVPSNVRQLRKQGENLFSAPKDAMAHAQGRIVSEHREESNVDATTGMVSMIEASRAYQLNANLLQIQDRMTEDAIARVGRPA